MKKITNAERVREIFMETDAVEAKSLLMMAHTIVDVRFPEPVKPKPARKLKEQNGMKNNLLIAMLAAVAVGGMGNSTIHSPVMSDDDSAGSYCEMYGCDEPWIWQE